MNLIDNEIIKAFEDAVICVGQAPFVEKVAKGEQLKSEIIDLINRQKAEKEAMLSHIKCLQYENDKLRTRNDELNALNKTASQEAIKEFWNRLSENADATQVDAFHSAYVIKDEDAENLIKEMTEKGGAKE